MIKQIAKMKKGGKWLNCAANTAKELHKRMAQAVKKR